MEIKSEYQAIAEAIETGDAEAGVKEVNKLLAEDQNALDIVEQALVPILKDVGDRFSRMELFLPELIRAAGVVKAVQPILQEKLNTGEGGTAGRIVLGTVYGDVHDIGKNIVAAMLEANGFEVHDIGVDVSSVDFVNRARDLDADIVAISSLMTTSIPYVKDVVDLIKGNPAFADKFKILIGGGPVTQETADELGVDGYGDDAADAVRMAQALISN
jgi:methanogenic corrinoid protein MtbC1